MVKIIFSNVTAIRQTNVYRNFTRYMKYFRAVIENFYVAQANKQRALASYKQNLMGRDNGRIIRHNLLKKSILNNTNVNICLIFIFKVVNGRISCNRFSMYRTKI